VARLDELRLSVQEQRLKVRIELGRCAEATNCADCSKLIHCVKNSGSS
jgi:hypothetical protein